MPALTAVIVASVVVCDFVGLARFDRRDTVDGLVWVIFYVGNWARAFSANPNALGLLGHTWSLAVEEQFYLLWPLALLLILKHANRRSRVALGLLAVAAAEVGYRAFLVADGTSGNRIYNGSDTHSDGLLIGCALAFALASRRRHARQLPARLRATVTFLALVATAVLFATGSPAPSAARFAVCCSVMPVLTAVVLWNQLTTPLAPLRALLSWQPLVWVGTRSYGLYLWHLPIYQVVARATLAGPDPRVESDLLRVGLSLVAATLSYVVIERPALKWKTRFQRTEALPASTVRGVRTSISTWRATRSGDPWRPATSPDSA